jgi:hypothetical protein
MTAQRDAGKLEDLLQADIDNTFSSRDEQKVKIMPSATSVFSVLLQLHPRREDDELALASTRPPLSECSQEEVEKRAGELRLEADTRLRDLERYGRSAGRAPARDLGCLQEHQEGDTHHR